MLWLRRFPGTSSCGGGLLHFSRSVDWNSFAHFNLHNMTKILTATVFRRLRMARRFQVGGRRGMGIGEVVEFLECPSVRCWGAARDDGVAVCNRSRLGLGQRTNGRFPIMAYY